jgi:DNA-binding CsgD family transcriptional regulator
MEITLGEEWSRVLSPREREIALLVARGLSNKEVARELGLSDGTVKISLHGIFRKLGTKSRYSLIVQGHAAVGARQISSSWVIASAASPFSWKHALNDSIVAFAARQRRDLPNSNHLIANRSIVGQRTAMQR